SVIHKRFGVNCFSEDTGLEVPALNGEPGVRSARYAGEICSASDNIDLLLSRMKNIENREAQFRTVVSLILEDTEYQFEGIAKGRISHSRKGEKGFGYDPIFVPEGYDISFAEMGAAEKNRISHRGKAIKKLVEFLKNY
ncbi:MAG: non-canonical purine NTP pyrophosphatase, partial [Chitinophagales bacterium]